jgi:hypothetical protein
MFASAGTMAEMETFGRALQRGRRPAPNVGDPVMWQRGCSVGRGAPDPAHGATAGLLVSLGWDDRRIGDLRSGVPAGSETLAERTWAIRYDSRARGLRQKPRIHATTAKTRTANAAGTIDEGSGTEVKEAKETVVSPIG